jgi:phenylpropionate dioxygenase-like ring-hydroxylating dioxygenase large terminal subunit
MPDISVRSYPVREKQGTIWFSFSEDPYTAEPPDWRFLDAKGFMSVLDVSCNYIRIMENLVDNPHAGYIHAGLLRREPTTKVVADIVETPLSIFIQTRGDNMNNSLLYKLFGKKGEEVRHIEEYLAPNQMVSTYNQSGNIAALQSFCVPVDHHRTRWFFRISLRFGHASRLLFPVFKAMVYRIVVQDQRIAERADAQDQLFPHAPMHSTKADAPSTLVAHSAKAFATNGPTDAFRERRRTVNYML